MLDHFGLKNRVWLANGDPGVVIAKRWAMTMQVEYRIKWDDGTTATWERQSNLRQYPPNNPCKGIKEV